MKDPICIECTGDLKLTKVKGNDTAPIFTHDNNSIASEVLPMQLCKILEGIQIWRIQPAHITFTARRKTCPAVYLNNCQFPQVGTVSTLVCI